MVVEHFTYLDGFIWLTVVVAFAFLIRLSVLSMWQQQKQQDLNQEKESFFSDFCKNNSFIKSLNCKHEQEESYLFDLGRNKAFTCKSCGKTRFLY